MRFKIIPSSYHPDDVVIDDTESNDVYRLWINEDIEKLVELLNTFEEDK